MGDRSDWIIKPTLFIFLVLGVVVCLFPEAGGPDKSVLPFLKWMGPGTPGTFEDYIRERIPEPTSFKRIFFYHGPSKTGTFQLPAEKKILVIASSKTFSSLGDKIMRYCSDVRNQGYAVGLHEHSGTDPVGLKSFILSRKQNLLGCVFVGDLPVAWYEVENDYYEYGYAEFPCDLYYMDLDGVWEDLDGDGRLDSHRDGGGDRQPDIFVGRIDASRIPGDGIDILNVYFDKNHQYRIGNTYVLSYGLTYTEDDWSIYTDMVNDISFLYSGRYDAITAPSTDRDDYLENRLLNVKYDFIQLACHSNSTAHYFVRNGLLHSDEVKNAPPQALAYNLFCCSALRFTDFNCLGKAYVFNPGLKTLVVVGSTKTGSMLEFSYFYRSLGAGNPVGYALMEWFQRIAPYDIFDVFWHYGMTLMGDPMLSVIPDETEVSPPINPQGSLEENRSFLLTEYVNVLTWEYNPLNEGKDVTGIRVYVIEQSGEILLQELDPNQTEYMHRKVDPDKRHVYALVNVGSQGRESRPAVVEIYGQN